MQEDSKKTLYLVLGAASQAIVNRAELDFAIRLVERLKSSQLNWEAVIVDGPGWDAKEVYPLNCEVLYGDNDELVDYFEEQ